MSEVEVQPVAEEVAMTTEAAIRPDYVPEKFWNVEAGEINMEEFGKSYTNLEKYVGGKRDELREVIKNEMNEELVNATPESYVLPKLPENFTEEMITENPMSAWWGDFCKSNSYTQEVYEQGINKYIDGFVGSMPNMETEMSNLGENATVRLDAVNAWASTFFSPTEYEAIASSLGATSSGVEALERVMEAQRETLGNASRVAQPERPLTIADVRVMMDDPRYSDQRKRDNDYVAKVDEAFMRLYR
jgi:hypothetical protein